MARFEHRVQVAGVPQRWFDSLVAALFDGVEERLVAGRFTHPDFVLTVGTWDRTGAAAGVVQGRDWGAPEPISFELRSPSRPTSLVVNRVTATGTWTATGDLRAWRCEASIDDRLAVGWVRLAVADPAAAMWDLKVSADLDFGPWGRVLVALARPWAKRMFAKTVHNAADEWEKEVAPRLRRDPADVAAELLRGPTPTEL